MSDYDNAIKKLTSLCGNLFKDMNKLSFDYNKDLSKLDSVFNQIIRKLPKSCKETDLYENTVKLYKPKDIRLEDLIWLEKECWSDKTITELQNQIRLEKEKTQYDLFNYIDYVVNHMELPFREKTIVLISHVEPLLFLAFDIKKDGR